MGTVPTGKLERELRALYLRWLKDLPAHEGDLAAYVDLWEVQSRALIRRLGGRTASLGAYLADFPVPDTLELSPRVGVIYSGMKQAAIQASLGAGMQSTDAARQMFKAGLDKSFRSLNRLARTETVSAYWQNQWSSVADLPAIVMVWGAEMSPRTCDYCQRRDGLVVEDPWIRDHPNGRCTLVPTLRQRVRYKGTLQADGSIVSDPAWGGNGSVTPAPTKAPTPAQPASLATPTVKPQGRDPRTMSNAERLEAARIMYGDNSPQYRAARKRWG